MWWKCRDGKLEEVREELEAGADPNTTGGPLKRTLLMEAAARDHREVVGLLLSSPGIQVNAKSMYNRTALHLACLHGSVASLSKLLATSGLQLNETDKLGWTPIMTAIYMGKTEAVRLMAAKPTVCLDVRDNQGRSLEEFANE